MLGSMKTLSLDLRERILTAYDQKQGTREEIGRRFRVSVGMVKKLLQQRSKTGEIGSRHHRSGRKALIKPEHRQELKGMLMAKPDLTLAQMQEKLGVACTVQAIHYALEAMDLTYKKRRSAQPSKGGLISPGPGAGGSAGKAGWIRRGSSSSTSRRPRPI
jgi:transposase